MGGEMLCMALPICEWHGLHAIIHQQVYLQLIKHAESMINIHTQTPQQKQYPNTLITALLEGWPVSVCNSLGALLCVYSKGSVKICEVFHQNLQHFLSICSLMSVCVKQLSVS